MIDASTDDLAATAKSAGLRYVSSGGPGIRRDRDGDSFRYIGLDGGPIEDTSVLTRIKSLGIPPAWVDVWISSRANGHIQATGRDARNRKQYIYHPRWRQVRDDTKYHRLVSFGEALPAIRTRVAGDLASRGLSREKVLATVVWLLDETAIRIGNGEYARENRAYGLTTLRNRHVRISGEVLKFHFTGKGGKEHRVDVRDRRVARIVRRCQELPGQDLFQYLGHDECCHHIESADVNGYLRDVSGEDFTAKDFRTWHGTVQAARALLQIGPFSTDADARQNVTRAIEAAAEHLGNTPAICRKCYVHPGIVEAYLDGALYRALAATGTTARSGSGLSRDESAVLRFLRRRETTQERRIA
jgi:DNA topoisomerase I